MPAGLYYKMLVLRHTVLPALKPGCVHARPLPQTLPLTPTAAALGTCSMQQAYTTSCSITAQLLWSLPAALSACEQPLLDCRTGMMQADKAKKETQWAHLPITAGVPIGHTIIKVARDEDFTNQIGFNQFFDLVDHDKVQL